MCVGCDDITRAEQGGMRKTLWRNGNGQSEISKCHKSGFDGFLFACSGREKEKRGNPGAVEKKEKEEGWGEGGTFFKKIQLDLLLTKTTNEVL